MNIRPLLRLGIVLSLAASAVAAAQTQPDPNQPATTSGGLYTLETFPLKEIDRTLTMTEGVVELRPALGIGLDEGATFETWSVLLDGRYGLMDTLELQAGTNLTLATPDGVEDKPKSFYLGAEVALKYDTVDARLALEFPVDPDFLFDIVLGLPVRLRLNSKLALIGLERVLIIHAIKPDGAEEHPKPDLNISAAAILQLMDPLAIFVRGSVVVLRFEERAAIPVEVTAQYSVSNILDVGLSLILSDLRAKNPVSGDSKPFDRRAATLFARFRFGM